jgi:hypothetical protein
MDDARKPIKTGDLEFHVTRSTGTELGPLVYLQVRTGRASLYEFMTPGQARELAAELAAVADLVEVGGPLPSSRSFDEVVDRELAKKKFIGVAVPLRHNLGTR